MADFVPAIQEAPTYDAQAAWDNTDFNAVLEAVGGTGVISGCLVTQHAGGADYGVDVSAGVVVINSALVKVTAVSNLAPTAASTTDRKDSVYVNTSGTVLIAKGTPCGVAGWTRAQLQASPVVLPPIKPALPASTCFLGEIYIPGSATSIATTQLSRYAVPGLSMNALNNLAYSSAGYSGYPYKYLLGKPVYDFVPQTGADPTGTTDCTTLLQTFYGDLVSEGGSCILDLGPGTFLVGTGGTGFTITSSNVVVLGASPAGRTSAATIIMAAAAFTGSVITVGTSLHSVMVTDIAITSAGTGAGQIGITDTLGSFNKYPSLCINGLQQGIVLQNGGGDSSHNWFGFVSIILPTAAVAGCVGMTFQQSGGSGDTHHNQVDHLYVNLGGGGTDPSPVALNLRGCDTDWFGFVTAFNGYAGAICIQADYGQSANFPASNVIGVLDAGTRSGTTALAAVNGTQGPNPGTGTYADNQIISTTTSNGVPAATTITGWLASFNEPTLAHVLQANQTTYGTGAVTLVTSPTSCQNNNPFAVEMIVGWGASPTDTEVTVTSGATIVGNCFCTSSQLSTCSVRLPAGKAYSVSWFNSGSSTSTPTVTFLYAGAT